MVVYYVKNASELFDCSKTGVPDHYPFNIVLKSRRNVDQFDIRGPGIYAIEYRGVIVYLGSFCSENCGNILNTRIKRHLYTISMRGCKVGFGKGDPEYKFKILQEEGWMEIINYDFIQEKSKDTGYNTSKNRRGFAKSNWSIFKDHDMITELFCIHYWRIKNVANFTANTLQSIEKELIEEIHPMCNAEYNCEDIMQTLSFSKSLINQKITSFI